MHHMSLLDENPQAEIWCCFNCVTAGQRDLHENPALHRLAELVEVPGVRKDASQSAREAAQIMLKSHLPSSNQSGESVSSDAISK